MFDFVPVKVDPDAYDAYVQLFRECFPAANKFTRQYLEWLYSGNPDGQVIGFDARIGNRIAAHYVCIPARACVGGEEVRVLLSLNTATHPDFQGKGLFTKLAELAYAAGAQMGYDSVYGVANANSTPGFTRKLGFQLVAPLRACVGFGPLGIDFPYNGEGSQFRRIWSAESLQWRMSNPGNPISAHHGVGRTTFMAPALLKGACKVCAEIDTDFLPHDSRKMLSPLRLFLGMVPTKWQRKAYYIDIPESLRPSPLNLIFRSLTGRITSLDSGAIFLSFLDFDAY